MNIREFVKEVLIELDAAVTEANEATARKIHFSEKDSVRTVEFDIAVSATDHNTKKGKAGVKVLKFAEGGGEIEKKITNSTVSRITFGLQVNFSTKAEEAQQTASAIAHNSRTRTNG